jgi:hypothetical protein
MCFRKISSAHGKPANLPSKTSGGGLVKKALGDLVLSSGPADLAVRVQDGVVVSFGVAFVRALRDKDRLLLDLLTELCLWDCRKHGEVPLEHGRYWFHLDERGRLTRSSRTTNRKYKGDEEA